MAAVLKTKIDPRTNVALQEWKLRALVSIIENRDQTRIWCVVLPRRFGKTEFLKDVAHVFRSRYNVVVHVSTERSRHLFTADHLGLFVDVYRAEETVFSHNTMLLVDDYIHCDDWGYIIEKAFRAGSHVIVTSSQMSCNPSYVTVLQFIE